jgi:four helix bundle protein
MSSKQERIQRQIRSFRDLAVWKRSMDPVVVSHQLSKRLPVSEIYGLSSQIERVSASIPANIAEGHGRDHLGDYLHHLSMANSSLRELGIHWLLTERLSYWNAKEIQPALTLAPEIPGMLSGLSQKLRARRATLAATPGL